jgi:recombination protein RecA
VRKGESIKQGNDLVGSRTKVKVVKNKVAPPFKTTEFDIMYGTGISREGDILDMAATLDIVQKSGAWYSIDGDRMGQGRENAKEYLKNNLEVCRAIEGKIKDKLLPKTDINVIDEA